MKSLIYLAVFSLSFISMLIPADVYARMMDAPMNGAGMMGGMMWLMAVFWLLIVAALVLAIAALIKYLFKRS